MQAHFCQEALKMHFSKVANSHTRDDFVNTFLQNRNSMNLILDVMKDTSVCPNVENILIAKIKKNIATEKVIVQLHVKDIQTVLKRRITEQFAGENNVFISLLVVTLMKTVPKVKQ